jgi:ABC-type sugar transport system ATPase subunit
MVGGELARAQDAVAIGDASGAVRLEVSELSVRSGLGDAQDVSLVLHAGECLGLFGLRGSGAVAVADAVAGLLKPAAGSILLDGVPLDRGKVDSALARGVAYVPEDRHARGFVPTLGVRENLTLPILERLSRFGIVRASQAKTAAATLAERLQIVASGSEQPVSELSGGNQQKVVVGKWLVAGSRFFIVDEPTRGIDVGAKAEIYRLIEQLVADGAAVLMISSELPEVVAVCDRAYVMRDKTIVGELARPELTESRILTLAMHHA